MRIAFGLLLILHAALHLIGFSRAFGLTDAPMPLADLWEVHPAGVLWLVAALAMATAGVLMAIRNDNWLIAAAPALVLSQALIFAFWTDAKMGSFVNAILLAGLAIGWAEHHFDEATEREVRALLAEVPARRADLVQASELAHLPLPVARWLQRAGVVGRPRVRTVALRQRGRLRAGLDQPFLPAEARQVFTIDTPGFVWNVRATMKHVLPVLGRDTLHHGRGHMRITGAGMVTLVDAQSEAIDQGTLLRYLAEIVWFPSAALSLYIQWRAVDALTAEATLTYRRTVVTARFSFDAEGRFASLRARRYLGEGRDMRLETWVVRAKQWERWDGVEVPSEGVVSWKLAHGTFDYYRWEVTELEHDPEPLPAPRPSAVSTVNASLLPTSNVRVRG